MTLCLENGGKRTHKELKMLTKRKKQMELAGKSKRKFKRTNSTSKFTYYTVKFPLGISEVGQLLRLQ